MSLSTVSAGKSLKVLGSGPVKRFVERSNSWSEAQYLPI
jgi:hypothetical protein